MEVGRILLGQTSYFPKHLGDGTRSDPRAPIVCHVFLTLGCQGSFYIRVRKTHETIEFRMHRLLGRATWVRMRRLFRVCIWFLRDCQVSVYKTSGHLHNAIGVDG